MTEVLHMHKCYTKFCILKTYRICIRWKYTKFYRVSHQTLPVRFLVTLQINCEDPSLRSVMYESLLRRKFSYNERSISIIFIQNYPLISLLKCLFFLKLCLFVFLAALFLNYKRRSLMFVTFIRYKFLGIYYIEFLL